MRLKKLKSYNSKFFIYFIFLVFNFSLNASECKNIVVSKSEIFILNNKNAKKFKFTVDLADTKLKREIGLQCKKDLKENEGMLFIWNSEAQRYFWMKNTKFHLDIIFINSDLEIVDIFFDAKPYDLTIVSSPKKAKYILELKSGILKKLNLNSGDKLLYY